MQRPFRRAVRAATLIDMQKPTPQHAGTSREPADGQPTDIVTRALPRDGGPGGPGGPGGSGHSGGSGQDDGFAVDTGLLTGYVRSTRDVADELGRVNTRHLAEVRSIADDSFGLIGKESGFAAALDDVGAALQRQVKGVGANADTLATATSRTVRAYRDRDDEIAGHLSQIQR